MFVMSNGWDEIRKHIWGEHTNKNIYTFLYSIEGLPSSCSLMVFCSVRNINRMRTNNKTVATATNWWKLKSNDIVALLMSDNKFDNTHWAPRLLCIHVDQSLYSLIAQHSHIVLLLLLNYIKRKIYSMWVNDSWSPRVFAHEGTLLKHCKQPAQVIYCVYLMKVVNTADKVQPVLYRGFSVSVCVCVFNHKQRIAKINWRVNSFDCEKKFAVRGLVVYIYIPNCISSKNIQLII